MQREPRKRGRRGDRRRDTPLELAALLCAAQADDVGWFAGRENATFLAAADLAGRTALHVAASAGSLRVLTVKCEKKRGRIKVVPHLWLSLVVVQWLLESDAAAQLLNARDTENGTAVSGSSPLH